jgi:hypothetical protein
MGRPGRRKAQRHAEIDRVIRDLLELRDRLDAEAEAQTEMIRRDLEITAGELRQH